MCSIHNNRLIFLFCVLITCKYHNNQPLTVIHNKNVLTLYVNQTLTTWWAIIHQSRIIPTPTVWTDRLTGHFFMRRIVPSVLLTTTNDPYILTKVIPMTSGVNQLITVINKLSNIFSFSFCVYIFWFCKK